MSRNERKFRNLLFLLEKYRFHILKGNFQVLNLGAKNRFYDNSLWLIISI
jgi:hypothetical protein